MNLKLEHNEMQNTVYTNSNHSAYLALVWVTVSARVRAVSPNVTVSTETQPVSTFELTSLELK